MNLFLPFLVLGSIASAQLPPACNPYPNNCLYTGLGVAFSSTSIPFTYQDPAGRSRTLTVQVRIPNIPTVALPVVIWSHGGEGTTDAPNAMRLWSEATARAGYLTVSIAHTPRSASEKAEICQQLQIEGEPECTYLNPLIFDKPSDIIQVLDGLERLNLGGPPEIRGRIDLNRIAVAGHADGSSAALSLAGAKRLLTTTDRENADDFSDPRPVAFVALSPQSATNEGFFDTDINRDTTSWTGIARPVLLATGAGDNNCLFGRGCVVGNSPARRRTVLDLLSPGSKYEMFLESTKAGHDFFGSPDPAACQAQGVAPALCNNLEQWLRSTVVAFLDANVRTLPAAQTWIQNGLIRAASGNDVQWRAAARLNIPSGQPCPGFENCLYPIRQNFAFDEIKALQTTYTDVTGRPRTVEFTVRVPTARTGALPVVLWAHGGGEGRNFPGGSIGALSAWSEVSAKAGYLTVSPAFKARNEADQAALCAYLDATANECENISTIGWDRPADIKAILDFLTAQNRSGPFQGRIDLNRIAIGGHSAGSTGTVSIAGGNREFFGTRYLGKDHFEDPRPKAFIGLSPSAPGFSNLYDTSFDDATTSWSEIRRPFLVLTGSGDAHEQFPRGRRIGYDSMPPGDKYRLYVHDTSFGHGEYGDDLMLCNDGRAACAVFQAVLISTVLAYLDAYLQQVPQALTYLQNGYIQQAGRGILEWSKK